MQTLSNYPLPSTTRAYENAWVPVGHGLEVKLPIGAKNGDAWELVIAPFTTQHHLGSAILGNEVMVASESELLSVIKGNLVQTNNTTSGTFDYTDKPSQPILDHRTPVLTVLFNHVFLAKGRTLWWTDLDNYWNWYPSPESEADFRILEWENSDISALCRVNETLYLHFPTAIYSVEYVGKPTIVRILSRVHGTGSISQRAVVSHHSFQYFLSTDNFYVYAPDIGLKAIGATIWKKFTDSVTDFSKVWAYVDLRNQEICWVTNDLIFAFNYAQQIWTKYDSNKILSHATSAWLPTFNPILSTNTETILEFDKVLPNGLENLWVTDGEVCREQRQDDQLCDCLPYKTPFLQSADISYGDMHFSKSVDLVCVDGDYEFPWTGVRVLACGRTYKSEAIGWKDCGTWTKNSPNKQLDFPAVSGRVLNFRLEFLSEQDVVPLRWNGGVRADGRRGTVCNGLVRMDGTVKCFGVQFKRWDGTLLANDRKEKLNRFELAGLGERVDLPQIVIGPDK